MSSAIALDDQVVETLAEAIYLQPDLEVWQQPWADLPERYKPHWRARACAGLLAIAPPAPTATQKLAEFLGCNAVGGMEQVRRLEAPDFVVEGEYALTFKAADGAWVMKIGRAPSDA